MRFLNWLGAQVGKHLFPGKSRYQISGTAPPHFQVFPALWRIQVHS